MTEIGIDEPLPGEEDAETDGCVTSDRRQTTGRRHLPARQVVANAGEPRLDQTQSERALEAPGDVLSVQPNKPYEREEVVL